MQNMQGNWKIIVLFSQKQASIYPKSEETKSHKKTRCNCNLNFLIELYP